MPHLEYSLSDLVGSFGPIQKVSPPAQRHRLHCHHDQVTRRLWRFLNNPRSEQVQGNSFISKEYIPIFTDMHEIIIIEATRIERQQVKSEIP